MKKIGLLSTGNEITQGDILNTNSKEIAARLFQHQMIPHLQISTPDDIAEIEHAIFLLLQTHESLIITGGLGPTSDDLTRYALSQAIKRPLIFHPDIWELIVARIKNFGYAIPPESNRQQALFPEEAEIIANMNGTAAGCIVHLQEKMIFMLPGPPNECLPMMDEVVIPLLKQAGFSENLYYRKWLLYKVSEGEIAEALDALVKPYACTTGYRSFYPYLEFKLYSSNEEHFNRAVDLIKEKIAPFLV